jgi:hypothetical protein
MEGEMIKRMRRAVLAVMLLAGVLIQAPWAAWGCGWEPDHGVFTETKKPDAPMEEFLRGRLGIIEPAYRRIFLLAAYRQLVGAGLDAGQQDALLGLMDRKLQAEAGALDDSEEYRDSGLKEWLEARRRVKKDGEAPGLTDVADAFHQNELNFRNCLDDAFKTAAKTLGERVRQFGVDAAEVSQWLEAQDQVFANCSGEETIPAPPAEGLHPLITRDRAYQVASAHFYALHLDQAGELFEAIGNDAESPWRHFAPYLVGRVMLRKATLTSSGEGSEAPEDDRKDEAEQPQIKERLVEAEKQFMKVQDDPSLAELHPAARRLLDVVRFKLQPVESRNRLAEAILSPSSETSIATTASDYTLLLDRFMKDSIGGESFANIGVVCPVDDEEKAVTALLASLDREHDLTDWVLTFQAEGNASLECALKRYDEKGSLPWLIAVLSKIGPGHPRFSSISEKALQIPKDSPGYQTVGFHLARCTVEAGRLDEARTMLDGLLSLSREQGASLSTVNRLLTLRCAAAQNLDEFMRYAPRVPASIEDSEASPETPLFDEDSTQVINTQMPLQLLLDMAQNRALPQPLMLSLGRAVWVRALLLDNEAVATTAANLLKENDAVLRPHLEAYLLAKDARAKKYTGALIILRLPGLRPYVDFGLERQTPLDAIDDYRDNWWDHSRYEAPEKEGVKRAAPAFLSPEQKSAAAKEYAALKALGSAPTFLSRFMVSYGKDNPSVPSLAEALHLAVRSTRYGWADDETGKYSKAAFELLHKKYPKSEWAQKTPYWFK